MKSLQRLWWIVGVTCVLGVGCSSRISGPVRRVYEFSASSPRPVFTANPAKLVQWIDVPEKGGGIVGDGPGGSGSFTYTSGGTVGFADGSSEHFSRLALSYDGAGGESIATDLSAPDK
jgi:hypothetical protein